MGQIGLDQMSKALADALNAVAANIDEIPDWTSYGLVRMNDKSGKWSFYINQTDGKYVEGGKTEAEAIMKCLYKALQCERDYKEYIENMEDGEDLYSNYEGPHLSYKDRRK